MSSSSFGAALEPESAPSPTVPQEALKLGGEESSLNSIALLCRDAFNVNISLISFVENDRVWHQSTLGFEEINDVDHLDSFCILAAFNEGITVSQSNERETRTSPNRANSGQFYAAVPLTLCDGNPIGTLTIIDSEKRNFASEEREKLKEFGALASRVLELHSQITAPRPLPAPADGAQLLSEKEAIERFLEIHQKTFTICAWSKRIRYRGQWMNLEEFLQNCLDIRFTHGLSEEAYGKLMKELQSPSGNS